MASSPGKRLGLVVAVTALATIAVAALLVNIFERKQESRNVFFRVVELNDDTEDPAVWGKNFPLQYDAYKRSVDQVRTRYGGSEALRHLPSQVDPQECGGAEQTSGRPPADHHVGGAIRFRRTFGRSAAMRTCSTISVIRAV